LRSFCRFYLAYFGLLEHVCTYSLPSAIAPTLCPTSLRAVKRPSSHYPFLAYAKTQVTARLQRRVTLLDIATDFGRTGRQRCTSRCSLFHPLEALWSSS
jgi:hypothetical protein